MRSPSRPLVVGRQAESVLLPPQWLSVPLPTRPNSNVQGDSQTSICITIEPGLLLKGDILVSAAPPSHLFFSLLSSCFPPASPYKPSLLVGHQPWGHRLLQGLLASDTSCPFSCLGAGHPLPRACLSFWNISREISLSSYLLAFYW